MQVTVSFITWSQKWDSILCCILLVALATLVQFRRGSLGTSLKAGFHRHQIQLKPWSSNPGSEANRKWLSLGLMITGPEPESTSQPVSRFLPIARLISFQGVPLAVAKCVPRFLKVAASRWHPTPHSSYDLTKFLLWLRTAAGDYREQDRYVPRPHSAVANVATDTWFWKWQVRDLSCCDVVFFPATFQSGERACTA